MIWRSFWLGLIFWCVSYGASAQVVSHLPAAIAQIMNEHQVDSNGFSLLIQDIEQERPLAMLNAQTKRSPASLTKLLTTSAGLIRMGADFRWPTRFYVDHLPDANGVIEGNLYVQGGGDPFLVEERLRQFLVDLREKGVRHITGDIVLDNSLYYLPPEARDNESFDGNKWSAYNAVPHPLMVNFRTVKLRLLPRGNREVSIELYPNIANWKINNQMRISSASCEKNYSPSPDIERDAKGYAVVTLTGSYSTACGARELTVVMGEASEQFYYLFHDLWYEIGGTFDGGGRIGQVPSSAKLLYTGLSVPLSEQIQKMNQYSNNVMTRQLMLTLGVYAHGVPGSLEKGRKAIIETLSAFGVPTQGMVVDNGSGLSRETQLTAQQLLTLLLNMANSSFKSVFFDSLSVAGENGTLKKRFRGEEMAGKVVGKTGTLDQVRGLAGYVFAKSGHVYAVVMIGNGRDAVKSRYMQDDILRWVYQQ
ncbi:D-alanyl-D-alanine carboxypeptidase/D-alanyl-D-alanine endopeptidase [Suttonella ornithocola]|uniref:D-alanyl-D-alanine carboxypeptidase dacC n=1 Tax=Suttonella ornithocola TaxID=279832 RepID=A0A380MZ02_9GAMM|nr:D-alanyl-D-alanine carboxypeptidase/D-alanyl-D-alanine-endopeptidase [Suttonella ornithocola]SUO97133.1 D-alanyl-D-alanine carboxypeptidase dacC precursor [Suttonella ornithocola]